MRTFALSLLFLGLPQLAQAGQDPAAPQAPEVDEEVTDEEVTDEEARAELEARVPQSEGEFGPFYTAEPVSEVQPPTPRKRPGQPLIAVGGNRFCFVEDSGCMSSLIADFDFGVGMNVVASDRGINVPMTQWRVRGGFTVRPMQLARGGFHPWGVGLTVGYSQASPQIATGRGSSEDPFADVEELDTLETLRISMVHQIWLSQRRNALHVDFTFGTARSSVFDAQGRFWGTHAEVAVGWSGWASFFASADFLDRDLRAIFGFRTHAIAAGPIVGMVLLGMLAGGAL